MSAIQHLGRFKSTIEARAVIGETLRLARDGTVWRACCPFHPERSPSFTVFGDGYHCFGCGAHGDVFDWLQRTRNMTLPEAISYLGGDRQRDGATAPTPSMPPPASNDHGDRRNLALARSLWREASAARGTVVECYLRSRGLWLPATPVLKFHPACPRGVERQPAMLALMTDPHTNKPGGVHRTFLLPDGSRKADGKSKMMLGYAGVIRLADDADVSKGLGVTEGIETGLAVMQRFGWSPVWACGSSSGVARFPVLDGVECLTIFTDHDDVGLSAERTCAATWSGAGCEAAIELPPAKGQDWADLSMATS